MKTGFKLITCIFALGISFYAYLQTHNALTQMRMQIPKLSSNLREIREENRRLEYTLEKLESPEHLMQLLKEDPFKGLRYPLLEEILTIQSKKILPKQESISKKPLPSTLVLGTKP